MPSDDQHFHFLQYLRHGIDRCLVNAMRGAGKSVVPMITAQFGAFSRIPLAYFLAVKTGLCQMPQGVTWPGVVLVGILAGIGFTMAIFVGGLAFTAPDLLAAAKMGILGASATAAVLGLLYGCVVRHRLQS